MRSATVAFRTFCATRCQSRVELGGSDGRGASGTREQTDHGGSVRLGERERVLRGCLWCRGVNGERFTTKTSRFELSSPPAVHVPSHCHHSRPSSSTMPGPDLVLETFQASDFNVAHLVEALMEDDVRDAKAQGGGQSSFTPQTPSKGIIHDILRAVLFPATRSVAIAAPSLLQLARRQQAPHHPPRLARASSFSYAIKLTRCSFAAAFNPQPHIKTLESALSLLLPLRKANAAKTSELERAVAVAERAYRGDVRGAKAGFEVSLRTKTAYEGGHEGADHRLPSSLATRPNRPSTRSFRRWMARSQV